MPERNAKNISGRKPGAGFYFAAAAVCAALWLLFVGTLQWQEMLVGAGSVALSVVLLGLVRRFSPLQLQFRARDLAQAWRIPGALFANCARITVVLFEDIFTGRRAGNHFRVCNFDGGKREGLREGRAALATAYTTAAPNCIVIGVDLAQGRMLFHQLRRTRVSKMTQELGARP